jgi:hypothetical protein
MSARDEDREQQEYDRFLMELVICFRYDSDNGICWRVNQGASSTEYSEFDALPYFIQTRLSLLLVSPIGFSKDNVGRRVSEHHFWIYVDSEDMKP